MRNDWPLTGRATDIDRIIKILVGSAAQGLSNREIAERLHVSIRTVEGHRYRAKTKWAKG